MDIPAGLAHLQKRARISQLAARADWYLAVPGRFALVGIGDVSDADLRAVHRELRDKGVFVCVQKPRTVEDVIGRSTRSLRRITQSARSDAPVPPKIRWVALGARVAVLPLEGVVWVDDERLFAPGEKVPLPWTEPVVELTVVRPSAVAAAIRAVIGPGGPKRATLPPV